jgi:hypothetical protein
MVMWWGTGRDQVQTATHHQVNEEAAPVKLDDYVLGAAPNRQYTPPDYLLLELFRRRPGNRALPCHGGTRDGQPDQAPSQIACYCFDFR